MNKNKILKLNEIIKSNLLPLIDSDYVLIDIPDHDNIGDNLIWEGELSFLKNVPYEKKYECSLTFFQQEKIPQNSTILLHGGGNFGDIYPVVNEFRKKIISENKDKKIIVFPQTMYYSSELQLKEDAEILNKHTQLTICLRDKKSYSIAKSYFHNANILLLPDMAFCIDLEMFQPDKISDKTLIMARKDSEKINIDINAIDYDDLLDWPTFNMTKEEKYSKIRFNRILDKLARYIQKIPFLCNLVDSRYGLKNKSGREDYIKQGITFFNDYHKIYTTRLHGLILGILMGKKMIVLDNNYGKLSSFVEAWLQDFDDVEIYEKK